MRSRQLPILILTALLHSAPTWGQGLPPQVEFPPLDKAACVAKPQRLLIIDMKSGWWSGDGDTFHDLLLPRIVKDCPNVEIEYYFLQYVEFPPGTPTVPGIPSGAMGFLSFYPERPGVTNGYFMDEARFPSRPWNEYQQVWLLSGSDQDPTDWPTSHPSFVALLTKFTTPASSGGATPSLFLGGGIGHRDHANKVLGALELPEMFQTHVTELTTPHFSGGDDVTVYSRARVGAELSAHAVFEGLTGIADRVDMEGTPCDTDFLPLANHPFQIVGKNRLGEPSIAVRETETRRMVIDAGMPRFYSMADPAERDTYRYLQNMIKWLAR